MVGDSKLLETFNLFNTQIHTRRIDESQKRKDIFQVLNLS